jgi:2-oxoglutarate ferredoxin oxidoreductase subunit delta
MARTTGQAQAASKDRAERRLPRGRVTVFPNWCKGCDLCVEFCPGEVLAMGEHGWVVVAHPERCRGCHWCELHCPDFAIFVSDVGGQDEGKSQHQGKDNDQREGTAAGEPVTQAGPDEGREDEMP